MANTQGQKEGSGHDIIADLRNLSNGSKGLPYRDFEQVLREMGDVTISELRQIVTFTANQFGLWMVEWLSSPVQSPNTIAKGEIDKWRLLLRASTDELVKKAPEEREHLLRKQDLILLRHSLERRVDFNKNRPLEKLFAAVFSNMSLALDKLGFKGIAQKFMDVLYIQKGQ